MERGPFTDAFTFQTPVTFTGGLLRAGFWAKPFARLLTYVPRQSCDLGTVSTPTLQMRRRR